VSAFSQDMDATQIKSRMAEIRKTTNWDNPAEAKKANEEIKKLSKQLMLTRVNQSPANQTDSLKAEIQKESIESKSKIWNQLMESAKLGKNADILLGKPIREEIVEEYKQDEKIKFGSILTDDLEMLVIDMSVREIKVLIDNMKLFKSIRILIVTGGENNVPADLSVILKNASHYPLSALYIVNFKNHINSLSPEILTFQDLDTLGLFGNSLNSLPTAVGKFKKLKVLYIDSNPATTLFPAISQLINLEKLGLVNTYIPEAEILQTKLLLPNCEVLTQ
jgi:hypothetical protein